MKETIQILDVFVGAEYAAHVVIVIDMVVSQAGDGGVTLADILDQLAEHAI